MREERGRGQQRPHHFHMFNLLEESFALLHNELPPVKSHKCQEIKNNCHDRARGGEGRDWRGRRGA